MKHKVDIEMSQPVMDQPRKQEDDRQLTENEKSKDEPNKLLGLSSLSITNSIVIEIEKKCCKFDWDVHYVVKNYNANENVMLNAIEELHCCYFGSLQNVIVRDLQEVAIARVCYKEKSCFSGDMAMAVYCPPDILVGSIREISSCYTTSSIFRVWDTDGQKLFYIKYNQGLCPQLCGCSANFTVMSEENKLEVARILEKSKQRLRLKFKTKLNVMNKMILTGFCLGLVHKSYKQKATTEEESDDD